MSDFAFFFFFFKSGLFFNQTVFSEGQKKNKIFDLLPEESAGFFSCGIYVSVSSFLISLICYWLYFSLDRKKKRDILVSNQENIC